MQCVICAPGWYRATHTLTRTLRIACVAVVHCASSKALMQWVRQNMKGFWFVNMSEYVIHIQHYILIIIKQVGYVGG
jgi:hypothetical protein